MYQRITALSVQMRDLGASCADDKWVKGKFYNAILPYLEPKLNAIRQNSDYPKMTSSEVLSEIIAMDISKNNADVLVALPHNAHKNNLFLKSKVSEESESDEDPMDWVPEDIK
jgi:hypothetical protein